LGAVPERRVRRTDTVKKRAGIIGGVVGGAAAATAVTAVVAERRAAARRHRRGQGETPFREPPYDRRGTVVADDGTGLYYEEVGPANAPLTVIFVHGYTLNLRSYYFQRLALQERFGDTARLVFYDDRSHGRSQQGDRARATIDQLGVDLHTVLETLAPTGPVVLVGHSMGGMTLLSLVDKYPELVQPGRERRVVGVALLASSAGGLASVTLGLPALLARIKGPIMPLLLRGARRQANLVERGRAVGTDIAWVITRRLSFGNPDVPASTVEYLVSMIASTRIEVIADYYPALMSHDKLAALPLLADTRVVIICGDHDLLTPLEHSQAMAAALPDAELVVVPQGGHVALMEYPEVVNEALARLIESALADTRRHRRWWRAG
jgi:pimeloyl-ACP methyl ester carboxylesterase